MKKAAIIIDGGYVKKIVKKYLNRNCVADDVLDLARFSLAKDEELFRIYYYDCPPYDGVEVNPLSKQAVDFSQTDVCRREKSLQSTLSVREFVAYRKGVLQFTGWKIRSGIIKELTARTCVPDDLIPDMSQKRVDMKIGLDVAWLASKQIVDRIILLAYDSDFIPAMKFAKREGVQVILVPLNPKPHRDLLEHADQVRHLDLAKMLPIKRP